MKIAAAALIGAVSALTEVEFEFLQYVAKYGKTYASMAEYEQRLANFTEKHEFIQNHDPNSTYTVGHNKMSDWSQEEYEAMLTYIAQGNPNTTAPAPQANAPMSWVDNGCVNPIKDQGQCGSCWAFSAVASTEGAYCIASGNLQSYAEQQLVDCDTACYGCNGGWANEGFIYFQSHFAMFESSYPYTAKDGTCKYSATNNSGVNTTTYTWVTTQNIDAMKTALNGHVLSVAIEANKMSFQMYTGGVYNDPHCGTRLDHATNVVGWNTDATAGDYWIMRNSWGTSWGD